MMRLRSVIARGRISCRNFSEEARVRDDTKDRVVANLNSTRKAVSESDVVFFTFAGCIVYGVTQIIKLQEYKNVVTKVLAEKEESSLKTFEELRRMHRSQYAKVVETLGSKTT